MLDKSLKPGLCLQILTIPAKNEMLSLQSSIGIKRASQAYDRFACVFAEKLKNELMATYLAMIKLSCDEYSSRSAGIRALKKFLSCKIVTSW